MSLKSTTNSITFTPYSGFTVNAYWSRRFGSLYVACIDCTSSEVRQPGEVKIGTLSVSNQNALGSARVGTGASGAAYEGSAQLATSGEVRVFHSVANAKAFYLLVMWTQW